MTSPDPLLLLRSALSAGTPPTILSSTSEPVPTLRQGASLSFPSSPDHPHLPKTTPTRFLKVGADASAGPASFHTLEELFLAWVLRDAGMAEYIRRSKEEGMSFIPHIERKAMVDYLEGKTDSHPRVVEDQEGGAPGDGTAPTAPSAAAPTKKRAYVPNAADKEVVKRIRANEIELRDRNTVLRGIKDINFTAVQQLAATRIGKVRNAPSSRAPAPAPTTVAPKSPEPLRGAKKAKNLTPIIIISSSPTSLITMHNVKRFLSDAIFEPSSLARERALASHESAEDMITVYRAKEGFDDRRTKWHVVDSVEALGKFGPDAWDRVVCVMTTGQAWQFKQYKWTEPKELFRHVKGIHVQWANDPPNAKIRDWAVTDLRIEREKRHTDKSLVAGFWRMLDGWIAAHKPWLNA